MDRRRVTVLVLLVLIVLAAGAMRIRVLFRDVAGLDAKLVCSGVFVSGRSAADVRVHSLPFEPPGARFDVDRQAGAVHVRVGRGIVRTARYLGDQGCVALPPGVDRVSFEPRRIPTELRPEAGLSWPLGDLAEVGPPQDVNADELERAVALAFADPGAQTTAFLVVHRGRIIAERYAPPYDRGTRFEGWSMGKSISAALAGRLAELGYVDLDAPTGLAEWNGPADPRARITPRHLLRMSSGLRFSGPSDSLRTLLLRGTPDHQAIYMGMDDVFAYALAAPSEHAPGTVGRYRNSDPLALGAVVRRTLERLGEDYWSWPQRELFDPIGARGFVLETDTRGNFILTGFDYGTARDWARLGLLFLQDGVFEGRRLLPAGFAAFVATPAPAWPEPVYGGSFWLNRTGRVPGLPASAYWMGGHGEQRVTIVPSHGLVVVRLGHTAGNEAAGKALAEALGAVVRAVPDTGNRASSSCPGLGRSA